MLEILKATRVETHNLLQVVNRHEQCCAAPTEQITIANKLVNSINIVFSCFNNREQPGCSFINAEDIVETIVNDNCVATALFNQQ